MRLLKLLVIASLIAIIFIESQGRVSAPQPITRSRGPIGSRFPRLRRIGQRVTERIATPLQALRALPDLR